MPADAVTRGEATDEGFEGEVIATVRTDMVDLHYGTGVDFVTEPALAAMLAADVLVLSDFWWRSDLPVDLAGTVSIAVVCNDVFEGGADAQPLTYPDVESLYRMWRRDPRFGPVAFAAARRNVLPQPRMLEAMVRDGTWDLSAWGVGCEPDAEVRRRLLDWVDMERGRVRPPDP